jgi:hypothetical protein
MQGCGQTNVLEDHAATIFRGKGMVLGKRAYI